MLSPVIGMRIKFNKNVRGEYVTIGREYTIVAIQGNTVWIRAQGQTYIDWKCAVHFNAIEVVQ